MRYDLLKIAALFVLIITLLSVVIAVSFLFVQGIREKIDNDVLHVGVSFCGNTTEEAKLLIDRVKNYTNLLILQSGPVSKNETATNEICDYATAADLDIVVYFGDLDPRVLSNETDWRVDWINSAKNRWGDKLLGIYYYDEPGGIFIDCNWRETMQQFDRNNAYDSFVSERNYDRAASSFVDNIRGDRGLKLINNSNLVAFVSDYALYWFDYLAGYDVVLAQAGWNQSLTQDIALIRGAANMQRKNWGVVITWKYTEEPYLASGEEIFSQMKVAYTAGAKYILIFNYPQITPGGFGVMKDEHFDALERFWKMVTGDRNVGLESFETKATLVLPKNYAWGMRHPEDRIWGHWGPDEKSPVIWNISRQLLGEYGLTLDIIYDDANFPIGNSYSNVYFWNQTIR